MARATFHFRDDLWCADALRLGGRRGGGERSLNARIRRARARFSSEGAFDRRERLQAWGARQLASFRRQIRSRRRRAADAGATRFRGRPIGSMISGCGRPVLATPYILYRDAGIDVVWPEFLVVAGIGGLFFSLAILRFRSVASKRCRSEVRPDAAERTTTIWRDKWRRKGANECVSRDRSARLGGGASSPLEAPDPHWRAGGFDRRTCRRDRPNTWKAASRAERLQREAPAPRSSD
jgi:hypothetical protein